MSATQSRRKRWNLLLLSFFSLLLFLLTGFGTYATFNASAYNVSPQSVASGRLELRLNERGAGFTDSIHDMAPGDQINRFVQLTNNGGLNGKGIELMIESRGDAVLISNHQNGPRALHVEIAECSQPWVVASATCEGTVSELLTTLELNQLSNWTALNVEQMAAGTRRHLKIRLLLPDQDETTVNGESPATSVQGATARLKYIFRTTQQLGNANASANGSLSDARKWSLNMGQATFDNDEINLSYPYENRIYLKDSPTTSDATVSGTFDFQAGWGYGIFLRAGNLDRAVTGLTFQVDPNHNSGAFIIKEHFWGNQCGTPIAVAAFNGLNVYGKHDLWVQIQGNTLMAKFDGDVVMRVNDLDAAIASSGCNWPSPDGTIVGLRTWSAETSLKVTKLRIQ